MNNDWLQKYPHAFAMLQGKDDTLAYAPRNLLGDTEGEDADDTDSEDADDTDPKLRVLDWLRRQREQALEASGATPSTRTVMLVYDDRQASLLPEPQGGEQ